MISISQDKKDDIKAIAGIFMIILVIFCINIALHCFAFHFSISRSIGYSVGLLVLESLFAPLGGDKPILGLIAAIALYLLVAQNFLVAY